MSKRENVLSDGQTCTAPERILVQAGVYEEFLQRFVKRARALCIGAPIDPETDVTPLASSLAVKNIRVLREDHHAGRRGGTRLGPGPRGLTSTELEAHFGTHFANRTF